MSDKNWTREKNTNLDGDTIVDAHAWQRADGWRVLQFVHGGLWRVVDPNGFLMEHGPRTPRGWSVSSNARRWADEHFGAAA
jgi:hypothetical protein